MPAFIAGLPKAELHVHMQGAASVETVLGLSRRYPEVGLPQDEPTMREFYRFTDFANFIGVYVAVAQLVRTADDVYDLAVGPRPRSRRGQRALRRGDRHRRQPPVRRHRAGCAVGRAHARPGGRDVAPRRRARDGCSTSTGSSGCASGERLLSWCSSFLPEGSIGFGIGGPEADVPRSEFADIFRRAAGSGPAQRSPRRRDRRAGGDLEQHRPAGRRAHRSRHRGRAGSLADGDAGRARHRARGVPDVEHLHGRRCQPRRAPVPGDCATQGCASPSTPTTRGCSAPTSTASTRSRTRSSASAPTTSRSWRASPCRAASRQAGTRSRVLAEIDAYEDAAAG